jgi:hypothetical protein
MHVLALGFDVPSPTARMREVFRLLNMFVSEHGAPDSLRSNGLISHCLACDWALHDTPHDFNVHLIAPATPAPSLFADHSDLTHIIALGNPSTPLAERIIAYNFKRPNPLPVTRL